jgi:hypothetical protein
MQSAPAAYQAAYNRAIVQGYQAISLVEVFDSLNNKLADNTTFNVVSGTITVDSTANFRRYISDLVIVDNTGLLVPTAATDLFSVVSSNLMKISIGVQLGDGTQILFPQGIFSLEGAAVNDTASELTITVSAYDQARRISRNKFTKQYGIAAGTNYITAIQALINNRWNGAALVYSISAPIGSTFTTPPITIDPNADPWDEAMKMCESIGCEVFFDYLGRVVIRDVVDPNAITTSPSWIYNEGVDSTLIRVGRASTNEEIFNYVIVTGENSILNLTVRGAAWDSDPKSPTYAGIPEGVGSVVPPGKYGLVTEIYNDEKVSTVAQATASAQARINNRKGATEVVEFDIIPNPAHVEGDVVKVVRAKSKLDATKSLLLDKFNLGLGSGSGVMKITCRQRRV